MKNSYISVYICIVYLFISLSISAQKIANFRLSNDPINAVLSLLDVNDDNPDDIVDILSYYLLNPIDLNNTNVDELTELFILSPKQSIAIVNYAKYNRFHSIFELQLIPQLDKTTITLLSPFVTVDYESLNKHSWKLSKIFSHPSQELTTRLDIPLYKKKGYYNKYVGPSFYNSFRYSYRSGKNFYAGVGAEKDPGEAIFGPYNNKGYDYYTYYILLQNYKFIDYLALGKYRINWGQGLILGVRQFGSKFDQINILFQENNRVYKHSSLDEYNYFNGIAISLAISKFNLSAMSSKRFYDGVINSNRQIEKHSKTGLHRTVNEIDQKDNIKSNLYGLRFSYNTPYYYLSTNAIYYDYNAAWIVDNNKPYTLYNMKGNIFYNVSVDYGLNLNKILIRGEFARGKKGIATINKIYYAPTTDHEFLLLGRYYSKDYWGNFAKSYGSQSAIKNEQGVLISYSTSVLSPFKLAIYVDWAKYPWLRYRVSKPSQSLDFGVKLDYNKSFKHLVSMDYRFQKRERDKTGTGGKVVNNIDYHKFKVNYTNQLSSNFSLKSSLGYVFKFELLKEQGYHLSQRWTFLSNNEKLKADIQYTFFQTDSYDTRAYVYENVLLYSFSSYSFSGKGYRTSLNINYKPIKNIHLTYKIGGTKYLDRDKIGQGNEEIDKNYKIDMQFQLRLKF